MEVIEREHFDEKEFREKFLNRKVVVYRGGIKSWPAIKNWNPDYFSKMCPDISIATKRFESDGVKIENSTMAHYVESMKSFKKSQDEGSTEIGPYCHDIPIFLQAEHLRKDVGQFPINVIPKWYRKNWWQYVQFFMSSAGSVTPLHFDTLLTNNIFFQIQGRKCFTVMDFSDSKYCSRKSWRWYDIDPESPDLMKHPDYSKATPKQVEINSGDLFYMPSGTLHHVRSLDDCISFNIDFHNIHSLTRAFTAIPKGMPSINVYYNMICFLGVVLGVPAKKLFSRYKPYLNYVS